MRLLDGQSAFEDKEKLEALGTEITVVRICGEEADYRRLLQDFVPLGPSQVRLISFEPSRSGGIANRSQREPFLDGSQ